MAYKDTNMIFMPFGSIMNAYGLINKSSNKSTEEILKDIDKIYNKSMELVAKQNTPTPQATQTQSKAGKFDL